MPIPVLSSSELSARLAAEAPRWTFVDGTIRRRWRTRSWKATLMAVNAVGHLAELAWHHPEIVATFGALDVRLNTHEAGGVTAKDIELATRIDALLDWRPGRAGDALEGAPADVSSAAYFRDDPV